MIYIFILCVLIFFSLLEFCDFKDLYAVKNFPLDKIVFVFIAFLMFLIAALRYETGRDWQGYIEFFDKCIISKNNFGFEAGFSFINRFFKKVVGSFYVMQFCIMTFCCFTVYKSYYRRSEYPVFTLFLYFTMFFLQTDMAQTRQHLAMAILLCGMTFVKNRNFLCWCLVVFFAMQFHVTAITAFPLYFTTEKKVSVRICVVLFLISVIITFFGLVAIRACLEFFVGLPFLPERISVIGNAYLNSKIYGQQGQFGSGLGFIARYTFIGCIILFYSIIKKEKSEKNYYILNFFIALVFQAMGRNFDQFSRIANYYLICGGGLCAYNLLIESKTFFKKIDIARIVFCIFFLFFATYNFFIMWTSKSKFFNSYKEDYTPYKLVLFEGGYSFIGIILGSIMFMLLIFCVFYRLHNKNSKWTRMAGLVRIENK